MKRMRNYVKRLFACFLTLVLLFGAVPDWGFLTRAEAAEKLPFSLNTVGKYVPAAVGSDAYASYIMNGSVNTDQVETYRYGGFKLGKKWIGGHKQYKVNASKSESADLLCDVKFLDGKERAGMPVNVYDYNMWRQFGTIKDGKTTRKPAAGFSVSNATYVNSGSLSDDSRSGGPVAGLGKNANSGSWSATIDISKNPVLKGLAESGQLRFTFSALVCGALKEREAIGLDFLAKDYHTNVSCQVKLSGNQIASAGTNSDSHTKSIFIGWTDIGPNDKLEFSVSASKDNGNAGKVVGFGDTVLLFCKAGDLPQITDFSLNANADYRVSDTGRNQVLMDQAASMDLNLSFTNAVKPFLPDYTNSSSDTYEFMMQFLDHTLFTNLADTGFYRAGEKANLTLNKVDDKTVSSTSERISALDGTAKSLTFHWDGQTGYGDYYGNNPVPNTGDWFSFKDGDLANNNYGFWNKFLMASWHDGAGNPLADANGVPYTPPDDTGLLTEDIAAKAPQVALTIQRGSGSVQKSVELANPFTYDFIIDTIPPTYSVTSNGIQPDILSGLALNHGDEYDMTVNFSEGVQVLRFTDTGAATGYQPSNVCLQFKENSDMKATYVSGSGTKNWVFHAVVKDGSAYETSAMDTVKLIYQGANPDTVITDYVGNPLRKATETYTGATAETPPIAYMKLSVDNTAPEITITRDGKKKFKISAVDKGSYPVGLFSKPNTNGTTGASGSALIYYTWVKQADKDKVLEILQKNNYAAVKRYSLTMESPDGVQLFSANVGGGKSAIVELSPSVEDANWMLLVLAADMTWDGARQIIQYNKYKSYKNTEDGAKEYYEDFMEEYGGSSASAVKYTALTTKPDDWETKYFKYYTQSGGKYTAIPQTNSYPEFVSGRVYMAGYVALTSDPTTGTDETWNDVYTDYYIRNSDGSYTHPALLPAYPPFENNKYYAQYTLLSAEAAPSDWLSSSNYYELVDGSYTQVKQHQPPAFQSGSVLSVTFTPLPYSKKVSVQDTMEVEVVVDSSGTTKKEIQPKVDASGNPVYIFVAEDKVNSTAAKDGNGNPIYEMVNGSKVYEYYTQDGSKYTGSETILQSEVTDAVLKAGEYYVPQADNAKVYEEASTVAQAGGRVYHTAAATALTSQPSDWTSNYSSYYKKAVPTYSAISVTDMEWEPEAYYSKSGDTYTLTTTKPADWDTNRSSYYYAVDETNYAPVPALNIPSWASNTYYSESSTGEDESLVVTYTLLTAKPDNWDQKITVDGSQMYGCTQYYTLTAPASYRPMEEVNVSYQRDRFYKKSTDSSGYDLLTGEEPPIDWTEEYYTRYYVKNGSTYTLVPENVVKFESGKYYKTGYTPVTTKPDNWNTVSMTGGYSWYIGPTSTAEASRTGSQFVMLSSFPKRGLGLYDLKTGGSVTSTGDSVVTLVSAPAFASGTYYSAELSAEELANKFTDETRKNEFMDAILKAVTNVDKMRVISAYSEFAEKLGNVDRKLMQASGKYEDWAVTDYQDADSNWAYLFSEAVESQKPILKDAQTENDSTSNVTVNVKFFDDSSLDDATKYKFVAAGTAVTDEDETLWQSFPLSDMSVSNVTGGKEYSATFTTKKFSSSLANGSYDLYVRVTDTSENTATLKAATVTIDSGAEIAYALMLTEDGASRVIAGTTDENMTATARKSMDLSVKFAGKIDGTDLFHENSGFSVQWAFDASEAETASTAWQELGSSTEVTGSDQLNERTTKLFQIGTLGADKPTGLYYLHLRYSYVRNGETVTQSASKAFSVNTTAPEVTLNTLASTDTEVVAQATVSSVSEIASSRYVWIAGKYDQGADISAAISGAVWQDITLPGEMRVQATDAVASEKKGNVTLVIQVTDVLGNAGTQFQSYTLSGAIGSVAAPAPSVTLLEVQKLSDGSFTGVVELKMPEGQTPEAGSSYSVALVTGGAEPVWSRWIPYESMIRIQLGTDQSALSNTQLWFKFSSSTGDVTAPANYQKISGLTYPYTSGNPWAVVTRSTLQPVSMDTGVKLRFTPKTGDAGVTVTAADSASLPEDALTSTVDTTEGYTTTVHESGLYVYSISSGDSTTPLYVSVNNIPPKTAPSWKMRFSSLETGADPVTATLEIADDVSVDAVTFQPDPIIVTENGVKTEVSQALETAEARSSYTFRANGTAYFQLSNVSGGTTTAKAVVNWIDASVDGVTVTADYSPYTTVKNSAGEVLLANNVDLKINAEEPIQIYRTTASYPTPADQLILAQSFTFGAGENQLYQFQYRDNYGNTDSASYRVSNLVKSLPEPEVEVGDPDSNSVVQVVVRGKVPDLAIGVDGYRLYAGYTTASPQISIAPDGSYEYQSAVKVNGTATGYLCDNLNNIIAYSYTVDSIDTLAPAVEVTGTAWVTQGADPRNINWWDYVTAADNVTAAENLILTAKLENGGEVDTSVSGSHLVDIIVTDEGGNEGHANLYLYVMPADGMLVTDQRGVLFYAESSDVSLVENDYIELSVSRYQMMRYGQNQETVTNTEMTFDVFIQKGLYREGQLKYIQTVTFRDEGGDSTEKVIIRPEDLEGPGWYTIIVRNSEREREFTSFAVMSTLKTSKTS